MKSRASEVTVAAEEETKEKAIQKGKKNYSVWKFVISRPPHLEAGRSFLASQRKDENHALGRRGGSRSRKSSGGENARLSGSHDFGKWWEQAVAQHGDLENSTRNSLHTRNEACRAQPR